MGEAYSAYLGLMMVKAGFEAMLDRFPPLTVELVGEREVAA